MVRIFGKTETKSVESTPITPKATTTADSVPEPEKISNQVIIEREINLGLINEKLNMIINILQEALKE